MSPNVNGNEPSEAKKAIWKKANNNNKASVDIEGELSKIVYTLAEFKSKFLRFIMESKVHPKFNICGKPLRLIVSYLTTFYRYQKSQNKWIHHIHRYI